MSFVVNRFFFYHFLVVAFCLNTIQLFAKPNAIYAFSSQSSITSWKKKFGKCLNEDLSYNQSVIRFNEVAKLKLYLQLKQLNQIRITGEDVNYYKLFVRSVLIISKPIQLLHELNKQALKIGNNYFDEQFKDPFFQNFIESKEFSFFDILFSEKFKDPEINQDPRIVNLFTNLKNQNPKYVDWIKAWNELENLLKSKEKRIEFKKSLKVFYFYADYFKISMPILNEKIATDLIQYASAIQTRFPVDAINSLDKITDLAQIPYPIELEINQIGLKNKIVQAAEEFIGRIISRKLRSSVDEEKILITADHINQIRGLRNPEFIPKTLALLKNKYQMTSNDTIAEYLNLQIKPEKFAFDEFILKKDWIQRAGSEADTYEITIGSENEKINLNQAAAIDGMARTLVGEAGSCQSIGLSQFEAIGLIFASRAKSIEDYQAMEIAVDDYKNSDKIFDEQLSLLFHKDQRVNFKRYLRNNLRGQSDFGRKDQKGLKLDPVAQALSAPRQFDTWEISQNETLKLSQILGQRFKNFSDITFTIPKTKEQKELGVYKTVLCPLGSDSSPLLKLKKNLFDQALDIAKDVVLDKDYYLKKYSFSDKQKNKKTFDRIFFYTHGAQLNFASETFPTHILNQETKSLAPVTSKNDPKLSASIIFQSGTSIENLKNCNSIKFFKPMDPQTKYFID